MMTGKVVLRAIRAHLLVDAARNGLIISDTFDVTLPRQPCDPKYTESQETTEANTSSGERAAAVSGTENPGRYAVDVLYTKLMERRVSAEDACHADVLSE